MYFQGLCPCDSLELPSYDALVEDGSLSGSWEHCRHKASTSLSADGVEIRRTLRESGYSPGVINVVTGSGNIIESCR